jgi:hypothetical protein
MDEVVTSRVACCCCYGASDNFGLAYFGTSYAAAFLPQKIHEIRFRRSRASSPNLVSGCSRREQLFNYTLRFLIWTPPRQAVASL